MSFEDFRNNTPVIILTKDLEHAVEDKTPEDIYNRIKISNGQEAVPDTFNVGIMDSLNRDISLEAAITYLARSTSLFTNSSTSFLSHCEGDGIDVVKYVAPDIPTGNAKDVFTTDDTFIGAAYPQGYVENMLKFTPSIWSDFPHKNKEGWTVRFDGVEDQVTVITEEVNSSEGHFLRIGTAGTPSPTLVPGTVTFTSEKAELAVTRREDGTTYIPELFSAGIHVETADNMATAKSTVTLKVDVVDINDTVLNSKDFVLRDKADINGVIKVSNIEVPVDADRPRCVITVKVDFNSTSVPISYKIYEVMVQDGGMVSPYTPSTRENCYAQYNNVVEEVGNGEITVLAWAKFVDYSMKHISNNAAGPLFLSFGKRIALGGVHKKIDGDDMSLQLMINELGENPKYGNQITLPYTGIPDKYFLTALRIRQSEENSEKYLAEFAIVDANKVYISRINDIRKESLLEKGTIVLGYDKDVYSDLPSHVSFFNGPVTEVRYDKEWVNDMELYIASLARKPFSHKQSTDTQITTQPVTPEQVLDNVGINLVQNPTGRYAYISWNDIPDDGHFSVNHMDPELGNCFSYIGTVPASSPLRVYSNLITVTPGSLYSLKCIMSTTAGSSGEGGLAVRWLSEGEDFDPTKSRADDLVLVLNHNGGSRWYTASMRAPSGKSKAYVYMFADPGFNTIKSSWSKIKFEAGEPTYYTDDTGADYALYY